MESGGQPVFLGWLLGPGVEKGVVQLRPSFVSQGFSHEVGRLDDGSKKRRKVNSAA